MPVAGAAFRGFSIVASISPQNTSSEPLFGWCLRGRKSRIQMIAISSAKVVLGRKREGTHEATDEFQCQTPASPGGSDAVAEPVWAAGTAHRRLCCWRRERVVSRRKRTTMSPETEAVLDSWVPQALRSKDPDELAAVMPTARTAVAKTAPSSPTEAKRQLRALVPMLLDEYRVQGAVDLCKVLGSQQGGAARDQLPQRHGSGLVPGHSRLARPDRASQQPARLAETTQAPGCQEGLGPLPRRRRNPVANRSRSTSANPGALLRSGRRSPAWARASPAPGSLS